MSDAAVPAEAALHELLRLVTASRFATWTMGARAAFLAATVLALDGCGGCPLLERLARDVDEYCGARAFTPAFAARLRAHVLGVALGTRPRDGDLPRLREPLIFAALTGQPIAEVRARLRQFASEQDAALAAQLADGAGRPLAALRLQRLTAAVETWHAHRIEGATIAAAGRAMGTSPRQAARRTARVDRLLAAGGWWGMTAERRAESRVSVSAPPCTPRESEHGTNDRYQRGTRGGLHGVGSPLPGGA